MEEINMKKFYKCLHCGNVAEAVVNSGVPMICCGEPMHLLEPNTTDAAVEKHVPVVEIKGNVVFVKVGSVPHPMTPEHHISFIMLETNLGEQKKFIDNEEKAEATFALSEGEKAIAAYEYCNLHGFWKAEIK